ncbi:hypothetical protein K523DRAFT_359300 [Schizophyllum commune Tattone D]|nr:hypothetical protein K523DRAFT_359300 [Schizophyllum commune Tattone D]
MTWALPLPPTGLLCIRTRKITPFTDRGGFDTTVALPPTESTPSLILPSACAYLQLIPFAQTIEM